MKKARIRGRVYPQWLLQFMFYFSVTERTQFPCLQLVPCTGTVGCSFAWQASNGREMPLLFLPIRGHPTGGLDPVPDIP